MPEVILTLNAGSSSLKYALFSADNTLTCFERHTLETTPEAPLTLPEVKEHTLRAVAHRVVHGGRFFTSPVVITPEVLATLEELSPLAPLHLPPEIALIRTAQQQFPQVPHIACFDTAFHTTQPEIGRWFALPRWMQEEGILRYGFHGLSYEYIASVLPDYMGAQAQGRVVVAHLGNGASMCAMQAGRSIASSMGFSALDGLMMGTRCGSLDPGVLLYLLEQKKMPVREVSHTLHKESGLLGVSGISGDIRELLASNAPEAAQAVELFCYRAARELGSLIMALGGLDALVFTGGIGEHQAVIREKIGAFGGWLNLEIHNLPNKGNAACISTAGSAVGVYVIPTNEEKIMAKHTLSQLNCSG